MTVVDSGAQALDILRRSVPGTFQLILTVSGQSRGPLVHSATEGLLVLLGCLSCFTEQPRRGSRTHADHAPLLSPLDYVLPQDVMMPEVDGLELLRYVRSNNELSQLPVISEWHL